MRRGERYYRNITDTVLQRYYELEDGRIGETFDHRALDYRMDVELVLGKLPPGHNDLLALIHRDGLTQKDAVESAGLTGRPDNTVAIAEVAAGRLFEKAGLHSLEEYLA